VSDLPIHCLNSQVSGLWRFDLTKPKHLSSGMQNNCGHMMPDHERSSYLAMKSTFTSLIYSSLNLELYRNGQVDTTQQFQSRNAGKTINDFISLRSAFRFKHKNSFLNTELPPSDQCQPINNNWSMIYDEGFEIRMENMKMLLFN